jgi:hypothetical protein
MGSHPLGNKGTLATISSNYGLFFGGCYAVLLSQFDFIYLIPAIENGVYKERVFFLTTIVPKKEFTPVKPRKEIPIS